MRSLSLGNYVVNRLLMGVNLFFFTYLLYAGSEMKVPMSIITFEWFMIELVVLTSSVISVNGWLLVLTVMLSILMRFKVSFKGRLFIFVLFPDENVL